MARPLCSLAMPRPAALHTPSGRRSFRVKAFKEDEGEKKEGAVAKREDRGAALDRRRDNAALSPFRVMNSMMNEMQRMQREFDSLFGGRSAFDEMLLRPFDVLDRVTPSLPLMGPAGPNRAVMLVPVEVQEDDKQYTIHAEVPGFSKEHVKVTLSEDHVLTISGELDMSQGQKGEEGKEGAGKEGGKAEQPEMFTRAYRSFTRSFRLPDDAKADGIQASTRHGMLTVTVPKMPKPAPVPPKEIPITAAE